MKKMISFEIKKMLDKKIILIIICFFIINIGYIFLSNYNEVSSDFYLGRKQIVNQVEGIITQEKVDFLVEGFQKNMNLVESGNYETKEKDENTYTGYVYGDMNAFDEVLTAMQNTYDYHNKIEEKMFIIDENIERSHNANVYSSLIKSRLNGRNISSFYDTQGIENYLKYSYSFVFLIIIVILSGINYLYYDKNHDMENMIYVTKKGQKSIYKVRYLVMISFSILISLLFFCSEFFCFSILYDIKGVFNPIYSLPSFQMSYFKISILLTVILVIIVKILGILCITSLVLICAKKIKSNYLSIIVSFVISFFLWNFLYVENESIFSIVSILQSFSMYKIFSIYINYIYIVIIGLCILIGNVSFLYLRKEKMIYDKI